MVRNGLCPDYHTDAGTDDALAVHSQLANMPHRSSDLIAQGWFGLGPANPRLAERVGEYTLVMKGDYTIKDWITGEQRHLTLGVHGGVSAAEMYVPLVLAET